MCETRTSQDLLFAIRLADGYYSDRRCLSRYHARIYSQNGEDGIIAEIFRRIGEGHRTFVEIGVGTGFQNNTRFLLEQGWKGVWIDGDESQVAKAKEIFDIYIRQELLTITAAQVDPENVNDILGAAGSPTSIDFLSIDVDFSTAHVWQSLSQRTRVACVEYNASLPPSIATHVEYAPEQQWDQTNYFGASLKALELVGRNKNLVLVGCDLHGVNAFFVSAEETGELFQSPFTEEMHYQPPRFNLAGTPFGHTPSDAPRRWQTVRAGQPPE
jgi:hypothetical protein